MKKILLLVVCLLLTGCGVTYKIDFNKDEINETINFVLDGNIYEIADSVSGDGFYIEEELVKENISILNDDSKYYQKDINVNGNYSYATLNGTYKYNEFENSRILGNCFETHYIENTDEYLNISLSDYICQEDIVIKVSSEYRIFDDNADIKKDGVYYWNIKNEKENVIKLKINKKSNTRNKHGFKTFISITLVILFAICGVSLYVLKKR